jgi:23S rRNA-/tRNA-specific pseudouridylate synthase
MEPIVLHDNADFLVVYKPNGLNSDRDKLGNPSLEEWLKSYYHRKIFLVHRLDRPVSGILLCAKKKSVLQYFQENWENFSKKYLVIIEGSLKQTNGTLEHFHYKDFKQMKALISEKPKEGYKPCKLKFKKIKELEGKDLLEIELITGKYHQIRAQLAFIGHPIVGDTYYGSKFEIKTQENNPMIALHSFQLEFYYKNKFNRFEGLPQDFFWNYYVKEIEKR